MILGMSTEAFTLLHVIIRGKEFPFLIAQMVVLFVFVVMGVLSTQRFQAEYAKAASTFAAE